jgi:hypothetical protein
LTFLAFILSSSHEDGWIWALVGAGAGVYLFYRGFRILQRKRLIMNTPSSKIRSASMGLVEVNGLAAGPYTLMAPVTGVPCYYFRTVAWQLKQSGKNREWEKVAEESLHVPFYLDDNTGRMLVNPQGAELDVHRDFHEEFSGSFFSSSLDIPANASSFLMRHGVSTDQKVKIDEYCIKPKNSLFILGTLAENPGLSVSPTPVRTIPSNVHKVSFQMPGWNTSIVSFTAFRGDMSAEEAIQPSSSTRTSVPLDPAQQSKITAAMMKAGIMNPAAWAAAGVQYPGATVNASAGGSAAATAPAEEFDLQAKTVLMKGEHNPAFFISWQSQRDVVRSLGWKSALMIWGGPALTLACVYILATEFGWL